MAPIGSRTASESGENRERHGETGSHTPLELATACGHEKTKAVDEQIVAVVLPEDFYLAGRLAEGPAIEKQEELDA